MSAAFCSTIRNDSDRWWVCGRYEHADGNHAWRESTAELAQRVLHHQDRPEKVDHPAHYNAGKYEVIDVIDDQGWGDGFAKGNAFKYIARSAHKGEELEDLKKARWYIDWLIKRLEARDASKHDALGAR